MRAAIPNLKIHPPSPGQIKILSRAIDAPIAPPTIKVASELRWLAPLGLLSLDDERRYVVTEAGRDTCRGDGTIRPSI